jgi:hypothetical protein
MNDLERRRETAERTAVKVRNYRRARDRALARLRKQYPEDYALLLEEERERDQAEGKAWLDLSGRFSGGVPTARHTTSKSTKDKSKQAISNEGASRDLGGEA